MKLLVLVLSLFLTFSANGQYQLNGFTTNLGGGIYQLTPASNSQFGALWSKVQHDINLPFNIQGRMNFGGNPNGADGMAFVMQTNCLSAGTSGGGLGFSGISGQSFAVEFDTYQNILGTGFEQNNDPAFDHIAVEKNGDVVHDGSANNITAPIQMDAVLSNVKTGLWYDFQINYNPATQNLRVYFNGALRVNIIYDLKTNVFPSSQYVYWGITSTTGGFSNIQQIELDGILTTHVINDTTICTGPVTVNLPNLSSLRGTNLALNNPVTASSGASNAAQAFDGNAGSRWESAWGIDPQWIYVDLQSPTDIDSVTLDWEGAFATAYEISTSPDAVTWTPRFSTTTNTGGHNRIVFSASNVRYVRMYGTARSLSAYGYSLWEFKVYGQPKYLWSTNNGTNATISPSIYGTSVTLTPAITTTYNVLIPDPCLGYTTLSTTVTVNCPAPVEMVDFTVKKLNNGAMVEWNTASEINCNYFEVLKSKDGVNFYPIGTLKSKGNNGQINTYSFQDLETISGFSYYKIVSVDLDGQKQDSEIKVVALESKLFILPTPIFDEETTLIIGKQLDYLKYSIVNMVGQEFLNSLIPNPSTVIQFGSTLAPACYILKLESNLEVETLRFCKIK